MELDSSNMELVGIYNYCATYNNEWQMVADDDTIAHENFLFLTCSYLSINKITKSDQKYLNKYYDHFLADSNLYKGLKIFIGCKGDDQFMFSKDSNKLQIDVDDSEYQREVYFRDDDYLETGHFIYFGVTIENELFWFKFIKQ